MSFEDFQFEESLMEGLYSMGFKSPTPIQEAAIPVILNKKDLIACAQTGTGKTAAYLLPVIHRLTQTSNRSLNTLILAPTRELAQQIDQQIEALGYFTGISSMAIYGGGDGMIWSQQKKAIEQGADIIIATPGRLIGHLASGSVNLSHLEHLILDEADRMLDMGFYDDILRIISYLPQKRQTLLFSATMPPKIRTLANKILVDPEQINIAISQPAEGIRQQAYLVFDEQKQELLSQILRSGEYTSIIIFASTKETVKKLQSQLRRSDFNSQAFHSDLEQAEREEILLQFKNRRLPVLIGTDVLSRGIDVEGIDLVINYDVPPDPEDYIHRIGRTARASTTGTAITFINTKDQVKFYNIEQLMNKEVPKLPLPESIGEGPEYAPQIRKPKKRPGNFRQKKSWKPRGGSASGQASRNRGS